MSVYAAVAIHNVGIMALTASALAFTEGNIFTLLILFSLASIKEEDN